MADSRIVDLTSKATPAGTDVTNILDAADSNNDKKVTLADLPISTATQTAINAKQATIPGSSDKYIYKDNAGDVKSLESHSIFTDGSTNINVPFEIDTAGNKTALVSTYDANATENTPNTNFQAEYLQINIDSDNDGFDLGTTGTGVAGRSLNVVHAGESDTGFIALNSTNFSLGNGTDQIDVRGFGYDLGFGGVSANVNISGPMQGYGYQPNINAGASIDLNTSYTQAFYDTSIIGCPSPNYSSANFGPTIASITANSNYQGVSIQPTIPLFSANAGFTGINVTGNLGTFNGNGYYNGVNVNPSITSSRYAAGLNVTMDSVTPYAGVQATLAEQDLTFTFIQPGSFNNSYTLEYTPGATAGAEVVSISGSTIEVQIEDGVSTANQIKSALEANMGFNSNITITVSGTGTNAQDIFGPTNFADGEDAGRVLAAYLDGDVEITGALTFGGALSIGKLNAFASQAVVDGGGTPSSIHSLITSPTVPANATITSGDTIAVNTAALINIGDNATVGTTFIGMAALGLPAVLTMGSGSTLDRCYAALFALSLDAAATGGTVDEVGLCAAVAIPNGTTTVNNLYGFLFNLPFGDPGTKTFGFYDRPGANNFMAGQLLIGGTAGSDDLVANSSVALEIKSSTKAFLNARMTTGERNALTAVNGMQIYNTTTDKLQVYSGGSWVDLH